MKVINLFDLLLEPKNKEFHFLFPTSTQGLVGIMLDSEIEIYELTPNRVNFTSVIWTCWPNILSVTFTVSLSYFSLNLLGSVSSVFLAIFYRRYLIF